MDSKLSHLIKELREKRGMSQAEVARQLNMARPTYIQMEKSGHEPTASELQKMSEIFSVPVTFFFSGSKRARSFSVELTEKKNEMKKAQDHDIRISVPQKNLRKFKEVLLYILQKVGAKPNVGETVLYKLLYFIDFDFYEKYEKQLIGATYIKNHHGPTPVEFKKIVEDMNKNGEIEVVRSKYFQYDQKKYLPVRASDLSELSALEKEHIDEVLARLSDKNAKDLSDYSHADTPWLVHEMGDVISYETVFYRGHEHSVRNIDDEL